MATYKIITENGKEYIEETVEVKHRYAKKELLKKKQIIEQDNSNELMEINNLLAQFTD